MKTINYIISFLVAGILFSVASCSDDLDKIVPPPTSEDAIFNFSVDPENPNKVHFKANPLVSTWYTHWSFGDNSSGEGLEHSKVYLKKGNYDVEFKIFTEGGSASSIQTVVINEDFEGPNILLNGEFNGSEHWTVLPISDGVNVEFTGEEAVWSGGGWGQVGIYQAVHIEANVPYQIDMDISGSGMSDSWYEVYLGMEVPVPGQDYSDGGMRLVLNTWDGCGNEPFEGLFTEISCGGEGNGLVTFNTSGTYYLVIRGGGADYGTTGVTIDNASIRPLETGIVVTPPMVTPVAKFSVETNNLEATFTNNSTGAISYVWDFGDGSETSTEESPTHTYATPGTYTVKLTASNDEESDEITQEVTVQDIVITNSIQNGSFDDDSIWTIVQQNGSGNGVISIANGVATFNEVTDIASGSWGNEAHIGMYQAFDIEAGDYQFDMDITTNGIDEVWFEVWIGTNKPEEGVEYNGDSGATKVLSFNAWDCGDTNKTYTGKMAAASCQDTNGSITLEAGVHYILIRSGGFTFGEGGIVIDNVTMEEKSDVIVPVADYTFETNNLEATFSNTSTDATSYTWDFGDGSGTSSEENPTYTYASAGTYSVKLTAINGTETHEVTKNVTVTTAVLLPVAGFTNSVSELEVAFTNTSTNATSYTWDFGDGLGTSTDENPTYTYASAGTYTVKLIATNADGSSEDSQQITVEIAPISNYISNGTFDDETGWNIINQYETANTNGTVTIANGVVKFDETTDADWKHMAIYTAVELTAGTYQFEMDMTYTDISDIWGEVYIGAGEPQEGTETEGIEYSGDKKVLKAYNAWDCGDIKTYSGKATASGCDDANPTSPGQFEITETGTYYILFRTGGKTYGTTGIVIDNMSLTKVN